VVVLAGAVGPEQSDDLAALDRKAYVVDGAKVAEGFGQIFNFNQHRIFLPSPALGFLIRKKQNGHGVLAPVAV
jgi:hypothetical protein